MMKRYFVLICCVAFCGCNSASKTEMPMEEDKMVKVLSDARIVDEIVKKYDTASQDSVGGIFMDSLYAIHAIDSTQFLNMIKYLQEDLTKYHEIEKQVHTNLKEFLDGL